MRPVTSVAFKVEDYFPAELPSFEMPLPPSEHAGSAEALLASFRAFSEQYFSERETLVRALDAAMGKLVEIAERFCLSGGAPNLEELISVTGDHLEKVEAQMKPQLEQMRASRKSVARSRNPKIRAVMTNFADRNIKLMTDYVGVARSAYAKLVALRDRSIRQSLEALADEAMAGLWGDDEH
jgi:hypothetical protein